MRYNWVTPDPGSAEAEAILDAAVDPDQVATKQGGGSRQVEGSRETQENGADGAGSPLQSVGTAGLLLGPQAGAAEGQGVVSGDEMGGLAGEAAACRASAQLQRAGAQQGGHQGQQQGVEQQQQHGLGQVQQAGQGTTTSGTPGSSTRAPANPPRNKVFPAPETQPGSQRASPSPAMMLSGRPPAAARPKTLSPSSSIRSAAWEAAAAAALVVAAEGSGRMLLGAGERGSSHRGSSRRVRSSRAGDEGVAVAVVPPAAGIGTGTSQVPAHL